MEHVRVIWRNDTVTSPALRDGDVVAWPYDPPDASLMGRSYVLLDVGVKITIPPVWIERGDPSWYVDLVIVQRENDLFRIIDFDIDLFVPTDGRPYRTLDLDEFADAIEDGEFTLPQALDGLRRWQTFLDRYIHVYENRDVEPGWKDFPPACIKTLSHVPEPAFQVR